MTHLSPGVRPDISVPSGSDSPLVGLDRFEEHDACAIIARVKRDGVASHGNVKRTLEALDNMGHRTGEIEREGDGSGIQTDIPRKIWDRLFTERGIRASAAVSENLIIGHFMIRQREQAPLDDLLGRVRTTLGDNGFDVVLARPADVSRDALGPRGQSNEPLFYQVACLPSNFQPADEHRIFTTQIALERDLPLHVVSFSKNSVVYKVRGDARALQRYFPELRHPDFRSAISMGHGRFSTNTESIPERAQMFSTLGHNGEINTIDRLRREAKLLGIQLIRGASDSQDVDRIVESLMFLYDLSLMEAMEVVFPPVWSEVEKLPDPDFRLFYGHHARAFGALAQGPAAVIARQGDEVVFSADAMGLRPLWFGQTEKEFYASSEKGVVPLEDMDADPTPLAPGEKKGFRLRRPHYDAEMGAVLPGRVTVFAYSDLQQYALDRFRERTDVAALGGRTSHLLPQPTGGRIAGEEAPEWPLDGTEPGPGSTPTDAPDWLTDLPIFPQDGTPLRLNPHSIGPRPGAPMPLQIGTRRDPTTRGPLTLTQPAPRPARVPDLSDALYAAHGWLKDDLEAADSAMQTGKEPMGATGYDGPLAALTDDVRNLSDYVKERVAVVTNPAVDRVREGEHFSTTVYLGARPDIAASAPPAAQLRLAHPFLLGRFDAALDDGDGKLADLAAALDTRTVWSILSDRSGRAPRSAVLPLVVAPEESLPDALARLSAEAVALAESVPSLVLVLDDSGGFTDGFRPVDAHLGVSVVNRALEKARLPGQTVSLRRRASLLLRSAAIRSVHDAMVALGLGADAICPTLLIERALASDDPTAVVKLIETLVMGVEKVLSTMGIYDLRGYGQQFAAIGLKTELAAAMGLKTYLGTDDVGRGFDELEAESTRRAALLDNPRTRIGRDSRFYPKMWKAAGKAASGETTYNEYLARLHKLEHEHPVSLRHLLDLKLPETGGDDPSAVSTAMGEHSAPIYISAMSFGSQGEVSFRAYATGAAHLNIPAINGEGGELPDLMGKFYHTRGQQVASARFGVNARMLNSARILEIKVGQGAKPGEGGHLPAFKVTAQIAAARHTPRGVDLISPSNNHDIYSIEDLAQLIEELKTVNPDARISVKIPSIPWIAPIASGVAKAGADIVTVSGYDGGTGAARAHALKHVGFPIELGIKEAHNALVGAGLRDRVELWADGGMKSGADAVKLMLLGADRIGFGTLAMVSIGCTICRDCSLGTCHTGITAHFPTQADAFAAGLTAYVPRELDRATGHLVHLFGEITGEIRRLTAALGFRDVRSLVGRSDLLVQTRRAERIDLTDLLKLHPHFVPRTGESKPELKTVHVRRPLTSLTRTITGQIFKQLDRGADGVVYEDDEAANSDRAIGTHLAGELARRAMAGDPLGDRVSLSIRLSDGSIPGNGLGAFTGEGIDISVEGGAQDGVAKSASGGVVAILRGKNHDGLHVDGSVGKCFAYGAQRGLLIVQGNADSRCGIRLSGADIVIGGEVTEPLRDEQGNWASRANLKGFAFEYMTSGRAVVLGDPGPWLCSGMTGGVVYFRLDPKLRLTPEAIARRLARAANVALLPVDETDEPNLAELLGAYRARLADANQHDVAARIDRLIDGWRDVFIKAVPKRGK